MNRRSLSLRFFWRILLCAVISASSCKTAEFGFRVMNISGMVYDFFNRPVPNCEISLGKKYSGSTDINGRFTLPKIPAGTYTITGYKPGFETFSEEVIIKDEGQIIYIRIPSQNQLLNQVDDSLLANNFVLAEELAERAYLIDKNNLEMLFYYAAVKFRLREYSEAAAFLETARSFGSKDLYVDKFLAYLKEARNED